MQEPKIPKSSISRKPSTKRKPPEIKQTLTSYKRILNANPLLKYQSEGKPLPLLPITNVSSKVISDNSKPSLQTTNKQSFTTKTSQVYLAPLPKNNVNKKEFDSIPKNAARVKYPNYLKTSSKLQNVKTSNKGTHSTIPEKKTGAVPKNNSLKPQPARRSLSAQHIERKKGKKDIHSSHCFVKPNVTQSLEDLTESPPLSAITNKSIIFKTPSAYERRSIVFKTPISTSKRSLFTNQSSTPRLPSHTDLQKRLNDWLTKRGKCLSNYTHLKCFGLHSQKKQEDIDEENKENIEVDEDLDKGSYEDLKITPKVNNEDIAKAALVDLHQLILEGYQREQCENWLFLIKQQYNNLELDPQFWECRAAIEQARGNISQAVEYFQNAIINGAEVKSVDKSLDHLLEKFSLLNINTERPDENKAEQHRLRIIQDARNVFKSSIIQFAIQERKLKQNQQKGDKKELVATPVRRSTRLSRSSYVSTSGVQLCSSLRELDDSVRKSLNFQTNNALC